MTQIEKGKYKMFGTFKDKLDKTTCIISLLVISLITLTVASSGLMNILNIGAVFKQ